MWIGAVMSFGRQTELPEPRLATEDRCDVGLIKRNGSVGGAAMVASVMGVAGRNNQNIGRMHVVRPMPDPVRASRQHPDRDPVVAQDAPGAHTHGEGSQ